MKEILRLVLENPPLLLVPAAGVVLTLVILRIKKRYVNEGVLFKRSPVSPYDNQPSHAGEENHMPAESQIDLEVVLRKIDELASSDAYWYEVGRLLQRAAGMQAEIDALSKDLEQCRAMLRKAD